jgi:hypothetical protein
MGMRSCAFALVFFVSASAQAKEWISPLRLNLGIAVGPEWSDEILTAPLYNFRAELTLYPGEANGLGLGAWADALGTLDTQSFFGVGVGASLPLLRWDEVAYLRLTPQIGVRRGEGPGSPDHYTLGVALRGGLAWTIFDFDIAGVAVEALFDRAWHYDGVLLKVDITSLLVLALGSR